MMINKDKELINNRQYVSRLAPSPSGYLHVGHLQTFTAAYERVINNNGKLIFRVEDLDIKRCKQEYLIDIINDLDWFGIKWHEGPNRLDYSIEQHKYYYQSMRMTYYLKAWKKLLDKGYIYPCPYSRKDVERSLSAPNEDIVT